MPSATAKTVRTENETAFVDLLLQTVINNPYIPHSPTKQQAEFLLLPERESLYGGAAGGGKTDAMLMAALQYAQVPGYAALILRRTFPQLDQADSMIPRAHEWLGPTDAVWSDGRKTWHFPSGATLQFGHLQAETDKYNYQSAAYQFIAFDELTQFTESQYRYLFSRLRRKEGVHVPVRMRAASNPGGVGHVWVKGRFVKPEHPKRPFIPARLKDNPYLDTAEYIESLMELQPVEREQLLAGDWEVREQGKVFTRSWFSIVPEAPAVMKEVRFWDMAATEQKPGKDPDFTAGARLGMKDGIFYLRDMQRTRDKPRVVERLVLLTATLDTIDIPIRMEVASAGDKYMVDHFRRHVLTGFTFSGDHVGSKSKFVRAGPWASAAQAGNFLLVEGPWIEDFLDECEMFGEKDQHDDQIDAVSGAYKVLTKHLITPTVAAEESDYDGSYDPAIDEELEAMLEEMGPEDRLEAMRILRAEGGND